MIIPKVAEAEWRARLDHLPVWQPPTLPTIVIAPHPDDETLAAGGLIAFLSAQKIPVTVIAVTDGENAYLDESRSAVQSLGMTRQREQTEALSHLGVSDSHIVRLRMVDSGLSTREQALTDALTPYVTQNTHVIAPWPGDFHPDHEVCGRAAALLAANAGATLTFYFFWTWHRGTPAILEGLNLVAFPVTAQHCRAKLEALNCHRSQLEHVSGAPILPANLLAPAHRPYEVFLPS